jgi:hypothetical protein
MLVPYEVYDTIDYVNETTEVADPASCAALRAAAPTVDALPGGAAYVDPVTGDTYVGGTGDDSLAWDCPPYVT